MYKPSASSIRQTQFWSANPFFLLGLTPLDDRRTLIEHAHAHVHVHVHEGPEDFALSEQARAELLNPRTRLQAELGWLPGLEQGQQHQLLAALAEDPLSLMSAVLEVPPLARANLLCAAFERLSPQACGPDKLAQLMREFALAIDALVLSEMLESVNQDRKVSGFPAVQDLDAVDAAMSKIRKQYKDVLVYCLDSLPSEMLVDCMTAVLESATARSPAVASRFIDDLVDAYAVEAQGVLEAERDRLVQACPLILLQATEGDAHKLKLAVEQLLSHARRWCHVARPVQLSLKARGLSHLQSEQLARSLRDFCVDLLKFSGTESMAQRITTDLLENFAAVPRALEPLESVALSVKQLQQELRQMQFWDSQWRQATSFQAQVGLGAQDVLRVDAEGVHWRGQQLRLSEITQVRWARHRKLLLGLPVGVAHRVELSDTRSVMQLQIRCAGVYRDFVNSLWPTVCLRLMYEMAVALKAGHTLNFGPWQVQDLGVILGKGLLRWQDAQLCPGDQHLGLKARYGQHVSQLSYARVWNVSILEQLIAASLDKGGVVLSDYLTQA